MTFDFNRARQHLQSFNLRKLFIEEMGWDKPGQDYEVPYEGDKLYLKEVAKKRGLSVCVCSPQGDGQIPSYSGRKKIEAELRKSVHEHILIFTNLDNSRQVWQWVRREPGRPTTSRELEYHRGQSGDPLLQRLQKLVVTLEEEENLGIVDVTSRVRAAFDVEPVTRRFYDRYSKEHAAFLQFLKGIPDEEDQRWYASVTLNRLMFVYFIQKKLFLNNDDDYLRSKLMESKYKGADLYYRDFLCPLFFEGFAVSKNDRRTEVNRLLGDVPYLNGGIFQKHQLEVAYGKQIQIPDSAFERLFDFFDQYRWHLDERPLRNDKEINPDVLGYIFEKYINQKEMGAYYTKEDITGYISRSTILPYLLDKAKEDCAIAFTAEHSVWNLLAADPNRYIFPSVQKGVDLDLPPEIEAGINDVSKRTEWNKNASEEYALPSETWREVVARRTRYKEHYNKLTSGEVHEVNELITYNLDIEQFTQDLIESSEGPELLRAFWKALKGITILDPTCGSGAFLFAALNILEPLYEACLERMRVFIAELDQSGEKHRPEKFSDFREVMNRMEQHHNERYFILKSIIVNNLYGVDIMDEAVEICKLRLFLKLIAQVDQAKDVEPLPDIDFNIRAGNTLVGFTSIDEVEQALMGSGAKKRLPYPEETAQIERIKEDADLANRAYLLFQRQQLEKGSVTTKDKEALRTRLHQLNDEMNRALSKTYGVYPDTRDFSTWLHTHKPFHWYVDFFGIMNQGGFSVIIGNPPYIEYSKIQRDYSIKGFDTINAGNLYAYVIEISSRLLNANGFLSMIVQLPLICTDRMKPAQQFMMSSFNRLWFSNYDDRPAKLFDGLQHIRATIFIANGKNGSQNKRIHTTKYHRWYSEQRSALFDNLNFIDMSDFKVDGSIAKIGDNLSKVVLSRISSTNRTLGFYLGIGKHQIYYHNAPQYWIRAMDFTPYFFNERDGEKLSSHLKTLKLYDKRDAELTVAILNSSLFYYWFITYSNCRDLSLREIIRFPIDLNSVTKNTKDELVDCTHYLMNDLKKHSIRKEARYRSTGFVAYDEFFPKHSKPIIDEIDRLLATHYSFSDEELDFIINYDYKYRMGADLEETD